MEIKKILLEEANKLTEDEIQNEFKKYAEILKKEAGMDKFEASDFITSIMNLAIALQEKWDNKK